MAQTFNLPAVGDTMVEGEIVEWFVAVGDEVALDQTICSIETDKSVVEMTTPFAGNVLQLGGDVGATIEVGSPLIVVGEPGEVVPEQPAATPSTSSPEPVLDLQPVPDAGAAGSVVLSPVVRRLAEELSVDLSALAGTGHGGRITRSDVEAAATGSTTVAVAVGAADAVADGSVLAMPKVRRAAREADIDLRSVAGTGPRGSITLADLDQRSAAGAGERRERLSAMRRSIAKHLTESVQTIPQFTSMVDVDASGLLATRSALKERLDGPVPIDALLTALLIPVLRENPVANARLDGDEVVFFDRYDIGVAVDTPDGLMVPVLTEAGSRSVGEIAAEIVRLATAARERTIAPSELAGATCTVNNVGAVGIEKGTPILPMGTSTIIGFGAVRPVVQLRDGIPVSVPTMTLSATFDHRIIDGGGAGRFLTQLKQHLEGPALGLL